MRLYFVLLLCLALATCTTSIPQIRILQPASTELAGRSSFALIPPEQAVNGELPYPERYTQLTPLIRQELEARGYRADSDAQLRVYYWLAVNNQPLEFKVNQAPPSPLGPYQAIHRLRDETGTLRLRLTDPAGNVLWEGLASTGLSPSRDSAELLENAARALVGQIPAAR
ncbi:MULTISPECIES: DUF4136 domain-containing protein [unclassified Pseudomonas]|jgi:hypothetical protein|uniref:DUF4136 domain-containing protein n=1 Tax=unclassified Pseudomonas TaxID=196821 RepID=UPI000EA95BC4|nr:MULTISPECIES: DUF4136 domain-containing protein [unclassified Pseudomonas]AYF88807.1 DUF4136 domain-containing protein [Pseudomonas sp. DY-1]MDH4653479.1 DUF4136 domain-containing protein [Pseudomonas sp. BN606]MRK22401.1 DUF4136 domain-containing protein [Pseudomonas sp. JG-B]